MPESPSASFLADVIRSFKQLNPTDETTRKAIVDMLGFHEEAPAHHGSIFSPIRSQQRDSVQTKTGQEENEPPSPALPDESESAQTNTWLPSTLKLLPEQGTNWDFEVTPLPPQNSSSEFPKLRLEPLFAPQWTRGILTTALATTSEDGPLDIERIVTALVKRGYAQQLPRLPQPTLRRGVQLLIDKSDALVQFSRDQQWLQKELLQIVGADRLEILRFIGSPLRGARKGAQSDWSKYRAPMAGTVVLLLSDLGIGQPMFSSDVGSISEWLNFAYEVQRVGCTLVAFVPYAPDRWPQQLKKFIVMIQWDRKTSSSTVHQLIDPRER